MDSRVHRLLSSLVSIKHELGEEAYRDAVHAARHAVAKVALSTAVRQIEAQPNLEEDWKPVVNYRSIE